MVQHKSVRQIIYVFTGAREVKVLFKRLKILILIKFFFKEVLNGLDIMIGNFLDIFHTSTVFDGEFVEHLVKPLWLVFHFVNQCIIIRHNFLVEKTFEPL